jgi:hypothetical protein
MKTFKVEFEIVLKNDDTDWITSAVEDCLESHEFIDNISIEEVKPK